MTKIDMLMQQMIPYYPMMTSKGKLLLEQYMRRQTDPDFIDSRLSVKDNEIFWSNVITYPTDHIVIDNLETQVLIENYWRKDKSEENYFDVPSDLFVTNSIPLNDVIITMYFRDDNDSIVKQDVRIFTFCEGLQTLLEHFPNSGFAVGGVDLYFDRKRKPEDPTVVIPIIVSDGDDDAVTAPYIAYKNIERDDLFPYDAFVVDAHMMRVLRVWYGIQLSLLNPITEHVILKKREQPEATFKVVLNKKGGKKKRKVMYVRRYVITEKDLKEPIQRQHTMRCPFWYVIGHWRTYKKTGKKIFIQGYWKGVDREKIVNNPESVRQRILDMRTMK